MANILLPFQQRVFDEKTDLQNKIAKLQSFLLTPVFEALGKQERNRLKRQLKYMELYHDVLEERIEEFDSLNECSD